jgi:acyl dehydratase/NAD(P)-dependent dehydrogenase (short-subunit alcohol dehydrogenase family)
MPLAQRRFAFADQLKFASLSGDGNPLHLDPEWAADVFPGQPVVHGMHALLWALNEHFATRPGQGLKELAVTFQKPILLGDCVDVERSIDGGMLTLRVRTEAMLVAQLHAGSAKGAGPDLPATGAVAPTSRAVAHEELATAEGTVHLPSTEPLARAFAHVAGALGVAALRTLAGLSTLVGMECPGLRSMFSGLRVTFSDANAPDVLSYRVASVDKRFGLVTIAVEGGGLVGNVSAFAGRVEPSCGEVDVARWVQAGEFAGQRPLIVGGSRGLGAVTALLLAAGGASPVLTFRRAEAAAEEVRRRIAAIGGTCELLRFDATSPHDASLSVAGLAAVEQAYYFATPRIFRRRLEPYQASDHADFTSVYVHGFYELIRSLLVGRNGAPLRVFYPSSVAVDAPPPELFEYALAKRAGEQVARWLQKKYPGLEVVIERLPRIETGQTLSVMRVSAEAPHQAMLPIIRRMQERS